MMIDSERFEVMEQQRHIAREHRAERNRNALKRALDHMDNEKCLNEAVGSRVICGISPKEIVEAYRATGEYYDADYPGGIEQFVKDYEAGKFDE